MGGGWLFFQNCMQEGEIWANSNKKSSFLIQLQAYGPALTRAASSIITAVGGAHLCEFAPISPTHAQKFGPPSNRACWNLAPPLNACTESFSHFYLFAPLLLPNSPREPPNIPLVFLGAPCLLPILLTGSNSPIGKLIYGTPIKLLFPRSTLGASCFFKYCRGPPYASTQCYIVGNRCTNGNISDLY